MHHTGMKAAMAALLHRQLLFQLGCMSQQRVHLLGERVGLTTTAVTKHAGTLPPRGAHAVALAIDTFDVSTRVIHLGLREMGRPPCVSGLHGSLLFRRQGRNKKLLKSWRDRRGAHALSRRVGAADLLERKRRRR
jgi:hypothetical protein